MYYCITTPTYGLFAWMDAEHLHTFKYCVRQSQTEGGLGTLKSIATPYTVTYMHKSHMYIGAKVLLTELSHLVAAAIRRRGSLQRRV